MPHGCSGPMLAVKPSAAITRLRGPVRTSPRRDRVISTLLDASGRRRRAPVTSASVTTSTVEAFQLGDAVRVRAEGVAPVHEGHRGGDRLEAERPVDGAVAAADDDHVLAGVGASSGTK